MLSQVYKAGRSLVARMYPTTMVFKDGSSITIRYHEPRQILKMPITLEDCVDHQAKTAWQIRRRILKTGTVDTDKDDVKFDPRKYLSKRRTGPTTTTK